MLVINGELIAVAKRVPGHVVGDGVHTITELVDVVNQDPRRGLGMKRFSLDWFGSPGKAFDGSVWYTKDSVLVEGEVFYLRSTGNLSTGGTAIDMTDSCHPDNREMAIPSG